MNDEFVTDDIDENESNIIVLHDEDGNDVQAEFLDLITYEGNDYVVLLPVVEDEEDDDGKVVILQVIQDEEDDENEIYVGVDDEEVLDAVFAIFKDTMKDVFHFDD